MLFERPPFTDHELRPELENGVQSYRVELLVPPGARVTSRIGTRFMIGSSARLTRFTTGGRLPGSQQDAVASEGAELLDFSGQPVRPWIEEQEPVLADLTRVGPELGTRLSIEQSHRRGSHGGAGRICDRTAQCRARFLGHARERAHHQDQHPPHDTLV